MSGDGAAAAPGGALRRASTVEDVAARAQVSVATVSRALRGLPNVAPATRARVEAAAGELSYHPNPNASRLAAGRTRSIGIAIPVLGQWYFAQVLAGVEAALAPEGYDLLVYSAAGPEDRRRFFSDAHPIRKRVDGLILVEMVMPEAEVSPWEGTGIHVISIGQQMPAFGSVSIDDRAASRDAVRHLLNLGHREVGFIGAATEDDPFHFTVPSARHDGYLDALVERGVVARPEHQTTGRFTVASGRTAMDQLLAAPVRPSAVHAISDEMAVGAMQSIAQHGLSVPEDVSLIGFDDHEVAEAVGLTTVRQRPTAIGARAAVRLIAELGDAPPPGADADERLPTELVVRSSTRRVG
jgi:DNA-binding LacI/PurR family transcriptional regulator